MCYINIRFINEMTIYNSEAVKRGKGIFNKALNLLPFELHLPGHRFCGPGTKLKERLARGDTGINPLDSACKEHDIAYEKTSNLSERHQADKLLADQAKKRIFAGDSSLFERLNSLGVYGAMNIKRHLGLGLRRRRRKNKRKVKKPILSAIRQLAGRGLYLKPFVTRKKKSGSGLKRRRRRTRRKRG